MRSVKCSGCGANLNFDGSKKIMKCQYCGTVYKDDSKFEKSEPLSAQQTFTTTTGSKNTIFDVSGDRPKLSIPIIIILCLFGAFPFALLYFAMTKSRQKEWDENNSNH